MAVWYCFVYAYPAPGITDSNLAMLGFFLEEFDKDVIICILFKQDSEYSG